MLTVVGLFAVWGLSTDSAARAQVQATQAFTIRVPAKLSVTAPSSAATATLAEADQNQTFPTQQWSVVSNSQSGATVSFSTHQPFTHTARPEFQRDGRLDLAVASSHGPARWTVPVASARTNYLGSGHAHQATVRAVSDRPGSATFDLTVTFLADPGQPLESGDYALTVVGTLTAN